MSFCKLYVLDAPRIKLQSAAESFIDKWQGAEAGPANAKLDAFLQDLLQVYPDRYDQDPDGTNDDNIWYEGLGNPATDRPVIELDLKLAAVNAARLARIRELAGKYGLHLFDPEGYVLYLANGKEVSSASDASAGRDLLAATSGIARSADGLRFDGVYVAAGGAGTSHSYYRFTLDGRAYRIAIVGRLNTKEAFLFMNKADPFVALGEYSVEHGTLHARLKASNGQFIIQATFQGEALVIKSVRSDGQYSSVGNYEFIAVDAAAAVSPRR